MPVLIKPWISKWVSYVKYETIILPTNNTTIQLCDDSICKFGEPPLDTLRKYLNAKVFRYHGHLLPAEIKSRHVIITLCIVRTKSVFWTFICHVSGEKNMHDLKYASELYHLSWYHFNQNTVVKIDVVALFICTQPKFNEKKNRFYLRCKIADYNNYK